MGEAISKLIREDKILEQTMKVSVAEEVRSKYNADLVPSKKPTAKRPPISPTKEMLITEEPPSPKKKSRRGTSNRGGTQA